MKRTARLILIVFSTFLMLPSYASAGKKEPTFLPSEMLVKFKKGKDTKGKQEIAKIGAKVKERLSTIDVSRLKLPKHLTVEKAVKQFSKLDMVEYAEPNYIQREAWSPSDTHYGKQWGLKKIRAAEAWGMHTGRRSTIIAIVDTGVDLDHPDLKNKIVAGYDYVDDDTIADDVGGHGTHCAGIAAASSNNKKGVAGVCPNCAIMPVRVLGPDGGSSTDVAKGIVFAADNGAKVISLSLGSYMPSSTIGDAVAYAKNKGVILIAASGNSGVTAPHYPAYFEQCMAVGSTGKSDQQSGFSNYGSWVDVAAPGEDIYSSVPGGGYEYKTGTSMAAPHVAGLAGLMLSCPGATPSKVEEAIYATAVPVGDWIAKGRVDVKAAMAQVGCGESGAEPPPTTPKKPDPAGDQGTPDTGKAPDKGTPDNGGEKSASKFKVSIHHGTEQSAKEGALEASDDDRLAVASKRAGFSNFLDFAIETTLDKGKTYGALTLTMEAMSGNPGSFEIHLFNWKKGEYQQKSSVRIESSDKSYDLAISDAAGCVDDKGRVKIKIFRKEKAWNGFDIGIDRFTLSGASASTPPPTTDKAPPPDEKKDVPEEDKGESLSDKAKKSWDKFKKKL